MPRNILLVLICFFAVFGIMVKADITEIMSFGAPPSSTGAPGEITCAESGCHDDGPMPQEHQSHRLHVSTKNGGYRPGDTIDVSVHVNDPEIQRFGFQLTAVDQAGRAMGQFIITDPENTQILQNHIDLTDRQYVTYTKAGTLAPHRGKHSWSLKWIVPSSHWNSVHFYLATVSANDDNRDKGDRVYLRDTIINLQQMLTTHEHIDRSIERKGQFIIVQQGFTPKPMRIFSITGMMYKEVFDHSSQAMIDISEFPKGYYILNTGLHSYSFIR